MSDDITKRDKLDYLRNEKLLKKSTFHAIAAAELDQERGGRYAIVNKPTLSGSDPTVSVPKQPSNSYWSRDPCPPEPSLGFDINEQSPTGEWHEIQASLKSEASQTDGILSGGGDTSPSTAVDEGRVSKFRRRIQ